MKKIKFSKLKVGEMFALHLSGISEIINDENRMNIKVKPSLVVGDEVGIPFNVISLNSGQPRTFRDDEMVYKYEIPNE